MATTYPGIGNNNNWDFINQYVGTQTKLADNSYLPIPKYTHALTVSYPLINLYCDSYKAPSYYRKAGWFYQRIYTNIGTVESTFARVEKSSLLLLRTSNLIPVDTRLGEYTFIVEVPFWFEDITIEMFGYQGPIVDIYEQKLNTIETKIDSLIETPPP